MGQSCGMLLWFWVYFYCFQDGMPPDGLIAETLSICNKCNIVKGFSLPQYGLSPAPFERHSLDNDNTFLLKRHSALVNISL